MSYLGLQLIGEALSAEMGASLVAQTGKNLPAMQETLVQSLGWEDPLKREWLPTPVFLPGEFHGQRGLAGYSPWGGTESEVTERLTHTQTHTHTHTPEREKSVLLSSFTC